MRDAAGGLFQFPPIQVQTDQLLTRGFDAGIGGRGELQVNDGFVVRPERDTFPAARRYCPRTRWPARRPWRAETVRAVRRRADP